MVADRFSVMHDMIVSWMTARKSFGLSGPEAHKHDAPTPMEISAMGKGFGKYKGSGKDYGKSKGFGKYGKDSGNYQDYSKGKGSGKYKGYGKDHGKNKYGKDGGKHKG